MLSLVFSPASADPGTATFEGQVGSTFAGASAEFDIVTKGDDQYVAFYDVDRDLVVKHRTLPSGAWSLKRLTGHGSEPDSFKQKWDVHNGLRLAIDASGNLHVAGDMHRSTMRYWRTSTPGDITTLARDTSLVNNNFEDSVTYPEFILRPNGNLGWLMFRDGGSGNGNVHVYEWNNGSLAWTHTSHLFENNASHFSDGNGNAYTEVFYTLDDWYHIIYNWRESSAADSNSKFSYVKTQDFVNFENVNGNNVNTPITADAVVPTVDPVGGDTKFVNGEYQFITVNGITCLAYAKTGTNSKKQLFLATHDGLGGPWDINEVTQETGTNGVGLVGNTFPENYVVVIDGDTIALDFDYKHSDTGATGGIGTFTKRVTFDVANVANGPFTSTVAPRYFPDNVYQETDGFNGDTSHVKSDSRSQVQTVGNRNYHDSRPLNGDTLYVISWLAGPETFNPLPPEPSYPDRPIYIYKVVY